VSLFKSKTWKESDLESYEICEIFMVPQVIIFKIAWAFAINVNVVGGPQFDPSTVEAASNETHSSRQCSAPSVALLPSDA
jgi:hypothetical protein